MTRRALVWFRRDLRVRDNSALTAAVADAHEVVPVFVFDRPLLDSKLFGSSSVAFMLECLRDLADELAEQGLSLRWRLGDPCEEIPRLARDVGVGAVYWNRDYEPAAVRRDQAVSRSLSSAGILVRTFADHLVFEPHELRSAAGQAFQRYSAFRSAWWKQWEARRRSAPAEVSAPLTAASRPSAPVLLPSATDLGYEPADLVIHGGARLARGRLHEFLKGPLHSYGTGRNRPAEDATSVLSPHFRFGTLSPRTAIQAALRRLALGGAVSRPDVYAWIDELIWREFFHHVLAGYPQVVDGPFRSSPSVAPARGTDAASLALFQAWCEGRTGYPLVDAGMRQLNRTGWMHNRVRMVVASFLVKDLRLDWRWGERYFMSRLLDADLAVNNGNWQWCASTGTDAMPGFRVFNPMLQGKKFDPEGAYVRRFVQELSRVPTKFIHAPGEMGVVWQERAQCRIGVDYPRPIVEHQRARQEYLSLAGVRGRFGDGE